VSTIDASAPIGREPRAAAGGTHRLRREIGVVGLLFTSVGSIIGSGWLFGALTASKIAGPARPGCAVRSASSGCCSPRSARSSGRAGCSAR